MFGSLMPDFPWASKNGLGLGQVGRSLSEVLRPKSSPTDAVRSRIVSYCMIPLSGDCVGPKFELTTTTAVSRVDAAARKGQTQYTSQEPLGPPHARAFPG